MIPGPGQVTPICDTFPVAAAQTFSNGDLVYLASGDLTDCGADPAVILGIAREDNAASALGTRRLVEIIMPGQQYQANLRLAADTFTENTDNGAIYDIVQTGAGNWEVDKSASAAARVRVLDTLEKKPDGTLAATIGGPVKIVFIDANLQWGTAI
jgi:hypothetical protein